MTLEELIEQARQMQQEADRRIRALRKREESRRICALLRGVGKAKRLVGLKSKKRRLLYGEPHWTASTGFRRKEISKPIACRRSQELLPEVREGSMQEKS